MSLGREYENRMIGNIEGLAVAIFAGALAAVGEVMSEVAETTGDTTVDGSMWALFFVIQNYPAIILLVALAAVTLSAGPFGIFGFLFEAAGANVFFVNPIGGLILFAIGAAIIVGGARVWSWLAFIEWFISNRRGGGRRRGGRRGLR